MGLLRPTHEVLLELILQCRMQQGLLLPLRRKGLLGPLSTHLPGVTNAQVPSVYSLDIDCCFGALGLVISLPVGGIGLCFLFGGSFFKFSPTSRAVRLLSSFITETLTYRGSLHTCRLLYRSLFRCRLHSRSSLWYQILCCSLLRVCCGHLCWSLGGCCGLLCWDVFRCRCFCSSSLSYGLLGQLGLSLFRSRLLSGGHLSCRLLINSLDRCWLLCSNFLLSTLKCRTFLS
mmetsp:Transcript_127273/g.220264  ORF Transcript_127273/g.220264 Transcript_127273/m.220264 type:complete len:231 (-) Transcript_127273:266-958(-)